MSFSGDEIAQFLRDGFVVLRSGLSVDVAARCRDYVGERAGVDLAQLSSWPTDFIHLHETFGEGAFIEVLNDSIRSAIDELADDGRALVHDLFGWWPLLFPGFEGSGGWHVDDSTFQHRLRSREQALVTLYFFADIRPGDGGTAILRGSHHEISRLPSASEPDGLSLDAIQQRLPPIGESRVVELAESAGDIAFLHPFVVHGFGANRGDRVRVACNPQYPFHAEMVRKREDGARSSAEEAIRIALGWNGSSQGSPHNSTGEADQTFNPDDERGRLGPSGVEFLHPILQGRRTPQVTG